MVFVFSEGYADGAPPYTTCPDANLGKPIAESSALCIPTAAYAFPGGARMAYRLITGTSPSPLCELGWKSLGVLEITALPSMGEELWVPMVQETDALLVGGGDAVYLCHWMRQSGLADMLPSLRHSVYVGVSGGSMVLTPNVGEHFVGWKSPTGDDSALGIVGFSVFHTWTTRSSRATPWPMRKNRPPAYQCRPMRSTIRPPSK